MRAEVAKDDPSALLTRIATMKSPDLVEEKTKSSLLMLCVSMNRPPCVDALLARNARVDLQNINGDTPLMFAVTNDRAMMAKKLLAHGADPRLKAHNGQDAIAVLAANPTPGLLAVFFEAEPLLRDSPRLTSPAVRRRMANLRLFDAVARNDLPVATEAVEQGASLGARDRDGDRPLHHAAGAGSVSMVELLLSKGANVNDTGLLKYTPLMSAAYDGHLEVVRVLISHHANVNAVYSSEWPADRGTALMLAADRGHAEIVAELLTAGALVDAVGFEDATALLYAAREGHLEIVNMLLEAGANPSHRDANGLTPGSYATKGGHPEIAERLRLARASKRR